MGAIWLVRNAQLGECECDMINDRIREIVLRIHLSFFIITSIYKTNMN